MRLKDQVAIITGAASGIGKTIAERFAQEGAKVVIADRNVAQAESVAKSITSQKGNAIGIGMDVTNEGEVAAGVKQTIATFGTVNILISNAGVQHIDPIDKLTLADWKMILAIHLDGAFLTTRSCVKHMYRSSQGGSIIYMGSVHSKEGSPLKGPYVTAKHGLIGLCKVIAKEGAPYNVRANVICPGYVRTPLVDKQIPIQAQELGISESEVIKKVMLKDTVDGQFTTAEDIAETALFFASFKTNALTGQSLVVSHGWFMQ